MRKYQLNNFVDHIQYCKVGWKNVEERRLECIDTGKSEGRVVHLLGCAESEMKNV
jgi:hypothetical protein